MWLSALSDSISSTLRLVGFIDRAYGILYIWNAETQIGGFSWSFESVWPPVEFGCRLRISDTGGNCRD